MKKVTKDGITVPMTPNMLKDEYGVYTGLPLFTKDEILEVVECWKENLLEHFHAWKSGDEIPEDQRKLKRERFSKELMKMDSL